MVSRSTLDISEEVLINTTETEGAGSEVSLSDLVRSFWDYALSATATDTGASITPPLRESVESLGQLNPNAAIQKVQQYTGAGLFSASAIPYGVILNVISKMGEPQQVQEIINWMEEQGDKDLVPDKICYVELLSAWRNIRDPEKCDSTLGELVQKMEEGIIKSNVLNARHFSIAISSWANSNHPNAADRAEKIFELMKSLKKSSVQPTEFIFSGLISVHANSGLPSAVDRAIELFQLMQSEGIQPNVVTYSTLLDAYSKSKRPDAIDRVVDLFEEMKSNGIKPNAVAYNILIRAHARSNRPQAMDRAEELVSEMKNDGIQPNVVTYNTLLDAYSKSKRPDAIDRAHG
eukprot:CAMPEP_0198154686 /NCGR_PEP_ID=MMETSP1443-20131203/68735_1 /TAXON_ID=186043 /ORGANISM="Entomoneis sp., Strain CCMP2396" /LENGTH=347 /DNA_ID=CAMNT_0043821385 /DNA_START=574 /DNA_END=1614 /DNA_ORIENTATION=-